MDSNESLQSICKTRLEFLHRNGKLYSDIDIYNSRLSYELSVFFNSGYSDIILIIRDYIKWARDNNIVVGPGRGCIHSSTNILTNRGYVNVQDVIVGDKVVTIDGSYQKINQVYKYSINEKLVKIKTNFGSINDLILTTDHKVYCQETKKSIYGIYDPIGLPKWVNASDLRVGYRVYTPFIQNNNVDLTEYQNFELSDRFIWILGYWVGDGWLCNRKNEFQHKKSNECSYRIGFSFNKTTKLSFKNKCVEYFKNLGYNFREIKYNDDSNSLGYELSDKKLYRFFRLCFPDYKLNSQTKTLPVFFRSLSKRQLWILFNGLMCSDGSTTDHICYSSTSLELLYEIKELAVICGVVSKISIENKKEYYRFGYLCKKAWNINFSLKEKSYTQRKYNGSWTLIRSIDKIDYIGDVYDFNVENNSNYLTDSCLVHNSAAGSLVVYLSEITTIDPIRFNLIFERFLNPSRVSLPDIDTDFSDRDAVIDYLKKKYGENRVVKVGVPSLLKPRSAIDEIGRVLQIPFNEIKKINKLITEETLDKSIEKNSGLQVYKDNYPELFELAQKSLGSVRHTTTHPSAVILTENPIGKEIPLIRSRGEKGELVTQWDGEDLDSLGFVKLDILTVNNLTIISRTIKLLNENERNKFDVYDIDLNDKETLATFSRGEMAGVFQFEEQKPIDILKSLKNLTFKDVIHVNALIRPGVDVELYIQNRNNPEQIVYHNDKVKEILSDTYGVILFQEQVMKLCVQLANFTLPEADKVRKIIAKTANQRDPRGLAPVKEKFYEGCRKNNIDELVIEKIWEDILACQVYIFNLAHSSCYSYIAYVDVYLKTHYPVEYMCSALQFSPENKIESHIKECKRLGIDVLSPSINKSGETFEIQEVNGKRCIRVGLLNVKHVGNFKKIIIGRPFKSAVEAATSKFINHNAYLSMAFAGCFDEFVDRKQLCSSLSDKDLSLVDIANGEKEALGFFLSKNPLDGYVEKFKGCVGEYGSRPIHVKVGGVISSIYLHNAKTGVMAFLKLMVLDGEIDIVVWPSDYAIESQKLKIGNVIYAPGKITQRGTYSIKDIELIGTI